MWLFLKMKNTINLRKTCFFKNDAVWACATVEMFHAFLNVVHTKKRLFEGLLPDME